MKKFQTMDLFYIKLICPSLRWIHVDMLMTMAEKNVWNSAVDIAQEAVRHGKFPFLFHGRSSTRQESLSGYSIFHIQFYRSCYARHIGYSHSYFTFYSTIETNFIIGIL